MTLVLNRTYRFDGKKFWLNRFLRLYPAYYFACALTLVALIWWPAQAADYHPALKVSLRPIDWFGVLAMFPFPFYDNAFRPVPPTWSVGVEIVMYFSLFVFVARRPAFAGISALAALGYVIAAHWPGVHLDTVGSLPAALFPFSLGSLLFFAGDRVKLPPQILRPALVVVAAAWLVNLAACARGASADVTFYVNLLLCVGLVGLLAHLQVASKNVRVVDKFLGDLAYPLFLVHWTIGFFVSLGRGELHGRGLDLFFPVLAISLAVSVAMIILIDRPLEKLRRRVRPSHGA
jgi:peptidoglycan/LPS O-acetylase OafA/YrhL